MDTNSSYARVSIVSLFVFLLVAALPLQAQPVIVTTDEVVTEQTQTLERAEILAQLDRDDVKAQLEDYGVDPEQAQQRVAAMTNAEILDLQDNMDEAVAGGDTAVVLLLLIIIILLVT